MTTADGHRRNTMSISSASGHQARRNCPASQIQTPSLQAHAGQRLPSFPNIGRERPRRMEEIPLASRMAYPGGPFAFNDVKPSVLAMKNEDPGIHFFPEIGAGGFSRVDSTIQFYERINALVDPDFVLLDFGAGRGAAHSDDVVRYRRELRDFRDKVREVIGADIDPIVTTNPTLSRALVLQPGSCLPLPDNCVNLIISDFTFEHIEDPTHIASELDRILAPDGWICIRTPNRYGYVALVNRLTPNFLRMRLLCLAQPSRKEEDVFRPFYRLNTFKSLRRFFKPIHYEHFMYTWDAEPAYHANLKSLYHLFLIIHHLTPPKLRSLLLIFLHKKK
jgi:SAM-dependent methyltransferase